MATLLLRLIGPMQSWGSTSRFDQRDTGKEPSKSGVIGLLAASLGIDRQDWANLKPLTQLSMAVRHDRPGLLKQDYQTAGCARNDTMMRADGTKSKDGIISERYYLADAAFLIGLESNDNALLESIQSALQNPTWTLSLGRKSYVPSEMIWFPEGVQGGKLKDIMFSWPWISTLRYREKLPEKVLVSWESTDGSGTIRMDQPLSSFSLRKFGSRLVKSDWIPFPRGAYNAAS